MSERDRVRDRMAARRIYVADVRGADTYLRMTWHAEERVVVVSQWDGRVCTAATRVDVADAPEIIAFLANTLGDAAAVRPVESPPAPRVHWWRRWTARWRRPRAPVTTLPQNGRRPGPTTNAALAEAKRRAEG